MIVRVYRNLHRACWSVQAFSGEHRGRVIAHASAITLANARFLVSEAGRQRVLRERKKHVHAYVSGDAVALSGACEFRYGVTARDLGAFQAPFGAPWDASAFPVGITYSPYDGPNFTRRLDGAAVTRAHRVALCPDGKVWARTTDALSEPMEDAA